MKKIIVVLFLSLIQINLYGDSMPLGQCQDSLGKLQLQFFKTDEKNTVLVKMWNLKKNKPYNNGRYNLAATVKPVLSVEDNTFFGFLINSKEFKVTHRNLDGSIDWVEAKSWAIDYSMNDETKKEEMSFLDGGFGSSRILVSKDIFTCDSNLMQKLKAIVGIQ